MGTGREMEKILRKRGTGRRGKERKNERKTEKQKERKKEKKERKPAQSALYCSFNTAVMVPPDPQITSINQCH